MFAFRDSREGDVSRLRVDVAFTDSSLDLQGLREDFPELLARVEDAVGVPLARLSQVHGDEVVVVDGPMPLGQAPDGDALVTDDAGSRPDGPGGRLRAAWCSPTPRPA